MRRYSCALAAMALLVATPAHADPKDDARRHFAAGLAAAQEGDYEIALQRFLAAQEAFPHPATLFNIARSYSDLDDLQNALTYYRLYRDAAPDKAPEIDPVIQVLEARTSAPASVPTTAPIGGPAATGPVQVVVTGPTEEELARLRSIAAELEALTVAIADRAEADVAAAEAAEPIAEGPDTEAPEPELDVPDLPDAGFISDAYEKIVVTASRVGQDPLDSPSTLTVLTEDDIAASGLTSIPDILRRVAGVDAMSLASSHTDVSIRGFNRELNNKVLVLIDGRSTYWDFIGATFWSSLPVAVEEIERIEVIRGPGSAVYGANAVTGVINIITRTPGEQPGQLVRVDAGSPGFGRGSFLASGRTGTTAYRVSAGYEQLGRWAKDHALTTGDGNADPNSPVLPLMDDQDLAMRMVRAHARIDQTIGAKGFASASGGFSTGSMEFYNIGALGDYGTDDLLAFYLRGDITYDIVHLRSFWNSQSGSTAPWLEPVGANQTLGSPVDNDAVDVEVEAPIEAETGSVSHVLNVGLGYRYKRIAFELLQGGFGNPFIEHHANLFINEQATIGKLGVVGSLRIDNHPLLDLSETISPRGALLFRLFEDTSLRATAGTAFRAPNSIESYMRFALPSSSGNGLFITDYGDRETLAPERITTFELGVHDESSFLHTADAVVYVNQVRDLIGLDSVTPGVFFLDTDKNGFNVGETGWFNEPPEYTGVGLEAELELYPTDGLDLIANTAISTINVSEDGAETVRDQSSSLVKLNLGAMYRAPFRTDFSVLAHYVGPQVWRLREFDATGQIVVQERPIAARTLLSGHVGARPTTDERFEIGLTVWNPAGLLRSADTLQQAADEVQANLASAAANPNADPVFVATGQEHPKGQAVGGRLYGTLIYTF